MSNDDYDIKAKPTKYKGVTFRSQLEAKWASVFDELGIRYKFEPEAIRLRCSAQFDCARFSCRGYIDYIPDFYLVDSDQYVEIKGTISSLLNATNLYKYVAAANFFEKGLIILSKPHIRSGLPLYLKLSFGSDYRCSTMKLTTFGYDRVGDVSRRKFVFKDLDIINEEINYEFGIIKNNPRDLLPSFIERVFNSSLYLNSIRPEISSAFYDFGPFEEN